MASFLHKWLVSFILFTIGVGGLFVYLVFHLTQSEADNQRNLNVTHWLYKFQNDIARSRLEVKGRLRPLRQHSTLLEAFEKLPETDLLSFTESLLISKDLPADVLGFYRLDGELISLKTIESPEIATNLGEYIQIDDENPQTSGLLIAGGRLFEVFLVKLEHGGQSLGYLMLGRLWQADGLPSLTDLDFGNFSMTYGNILLDSNENNQAASFIPAKLEPLVEHLYLIDSQFEDWHVAWNDKVIQVKIPLMNSLEALTLHVHNPQFESTKIYFSKSMLISLLVLFVTPIFFGVLALFYRLRRHLLEPLDRLFLYIKILRSENRGMNKSDFSQFPLIRRLASELVEYTRYIEANRKHWQQKYETALKKIHCVEDLAFHRPWEMNFIIQSISQRLIAMLAEISRLKELPDESHLKDLKSFKGHARTLR